MQDLSVERLGLSVRTSNCLQRAKISYLSQLMTLKEEEMKTFRNMGAKSIQEVLDLQKSIISQYGNNLEYENEMLFVENILLPEDVMLIHKAFPECAGQSFEGIMYRDSDDILRKDVPIERLHLSVRTTNALLSAGYDSINKVAFEKIEIVQKIKSMGTKSVNELISFLRENADISSDNVSNEFIEDLFVRVKNVLENGSCDISYIARPIKFNLQKNKDKYKELCESTDIRGILDELLIQENIIKAISEYILSMILETRKGCSLSTIEEKIPDEIKQRKMVDEAIGILFDSKKIELFEGCYRAKLPGVIDWVETLKDNQKTAITLRLQGMTLEECGNAMGVTRERVRQITAKAIKNKPLLREDDFAYWYESYAINQEAFSIIFNEPMETLRYLSMAYYHGEKKVEEMIDDINLTKSLYHGCQNYIYRNSILLDGEYVQCKRDLLCKKLAQKLCSDKDMSFDDFYQEYLQLLKNNDLDTNEKLLFPSDRAFAARLEDSKYVLMKYGRKFRFYPIEEIDVVEFVEALHLEQYVDLEISTLKIYSDYAEVMQEYDIADEYELHNLLKKTQEVWNIGNKYNLVFSRMPFILFGNADREKQTEHLLMQVAPISIEEYCQFYEMEYGVLARTAMANMTPYISNYYHEGIYTIDQPLLDDEERSYLEGILCEDFYFMEDVKELYEKRFSLGDASRINPRTMKELGFRVFTNYIIRNTYASADDYFTKVYMSDDLLNLENQDTRIGYVQSANQALDNLRSSYELLEYEDKKYIKFSHLKNVYSEITKELFVDYVNKAIEFAGTQRFFTISKLIKDGLKHDVDCVGLGDWFNAGLLKNSKKIRFVKTGGGIIFFQGDRQFTTVDFIRYVLQEDRKMDVDKFVDYVKSEYKITLQREKISWLIKNSDMYYDSIMEKIYLTKEDYYDDI